MRVGLYNRWLSTLGGGEKHSLAIAEFLSQAHQVEVISHQSVPRETLERRLDLNLADVHFRVIPPCPPQEVSSITSDYDLFINASHLDYFPSHARRSATLIYFPSPLAGNTRNQRIKQWLRDVFGVPIVTHGVQSFQVETPAYWWLASSEFRVQLPAFSRAYRISVWGQWLHSNTTWQALLDGKSVLHLRAQQGKSWKVQVEIPPSCEVPFHTFSLQTASPPVKQPAFRVNGLSADHYRYRWFQTIFRLPGLRNHTWRLFFPSYGLELQALDTYNAIWANSRFTQTWIWRYWHRSSEVLYPPIDVERFAPAPMKETKIVSIGRFFAGQHNKKHQEMIRAFKQLCQHVDNWELHLVGGRMSGPEHEAYLESVRRAAERYPVYIHTDIPYNDLVDLLARSAIYWHASGYGESPTRNPERLEHFGITTVEAMAAGCVPVVINVGGQPEVVQHGHQGFLWRSLDELVNYTLRLIREPTLREQMAQEARSRSAAFSKQRFHERLNRLLEALT